MIGLSMAEQLRRAVMPPDILELQEEINAIRSSRRRKEVQMGAGQGLLNIIEEARGRGAVFG